HAPGGLRGPGRHRRGDLCRAAAHEPARRGRPVAPPRYPDGVSSRALSPEECVRIGSGPPHVSLRRATRGVPGCRSLCLRLRRRDRRARCDDHRQAAGHHRAGHTRGRDARLRGAASRVALLRRHHGIEAHGMTLPPRRTFADREEVLGAVMLGPALAYVILLVGVPFVFAILLSFSNATAGSLSFGWAGLGNYVAILGDPIFLRAL